jgi:MFS family permease
MGLIFTIGVLGNAISAISLARINPYWGYVIAQVMVSAFSLIMLRATALPVLAFGYFLLGGFRAARVLSMAQARELVHVSQMGLTYGVMETIAAVIFIVTPPLAGFIYEYNPLIIYTFSLGLLVVSIFISIIVPRRLLHV